MSEPRCVGVPGQRWAEPQDGVPAAGWGSQPHLAGQDEGHPWVASASQTFEVLPAWGHFGEDTLPLCACPLTWSHCGPGVSPSRLREWRVRCCHLVGAGGSITWRWTWCGDMGEGRVMNLGLWGSPPALSQVSTNEASPPPVLLVATSHTARQPAQRPLPAGCTVTHVLWGALQSPHFRVSRAWLHVPAAQLLPSERPCLAEPQFPRPAREVTRAPSPGVEGSSRVLSVRPATEARFSAELPTSAQTSPARLRATPISQVETLRPLFRFTES